MGLENRVQGTASWKADTLRRGADHEGSSQMNGHLPFGEEDTLGRGPVPAESQWQKKQRRVTHPRRHLRGVPGKGAVVGGGQGE